MTPIIIKLMLDKKTRGDGDAPAPHSQSQIPHDLPIWREALSRFCDATDQNQETDTGQEGFEMSADDTRSYYDQMYDW